MSVCHNCMQRLLLHDSWPLLLFPFFFPQSSVPPFLTPGPDLTPEDAQSSTLSWAEAPKGLSPQCLPTCEPEERAWGQHTLSCHAALSPASPPQSLPGPFLSKATGSSVSCKFTCSFIILLASSFSLSPAKLLMVNPGRATFSCVSHPLHKR